MIGEYAFNGCQNLESVVLPTSIEKIEQGAFSGTSIKEIVIPASVSKMATRQTSMGGYTSGYVSALFGAKELKKVSFSNGMATIPAGALSKCDQIVTATIPNTVTSIGEYASFGCTGLKDVYYTGSKDEWKAISVYDYNSNLLNATIHYNCTGEHGSTNNEPGSSAPFNQPTYIADIWSGNRKEKLPSMSSSRGITTVISP